MITTHVLDTARGRPAAGVTVLLEQVTEGVAREISRMVTDEDGRCPGLVAEGQQLDAGRFRLTFDTGGYFAATGVEGFYPEAVVTFDVRDAGAHHHVPLLLSPYGYSTYRGS